jgi:hypothetical protein
MNGEDMNLSGVSINTMTLFSGYNAPESPVLTDGKAFLDE